MERTEHSRAYAMLVGDGMADFPIPELQNRTPLAYASTPNMDRIASEGLLGLVKTVPEGIPPGSDVANMSLMGYAPETYYTGRAPIEAASLGVALAPSDVAFRCNFVTLSNGLMDDYSAGHIETEDAQALVTELQQAITDAQVKLYPGVSYRHLLVISQIDTSTMETTPPHDISGQTYESFLPKGAGADRLIDLMKKAREVLERSPTNRKRRENGKKAATDIWLWGQGSQVSFPKMQDRYGLTGSVISAVDLVRGLGVLSGLRVRLVEGATGYLGTNYRGKVDAAVSALTQDNESFVYLHVEAPDETSHEGSLEKKIQAIEEFDTNIVGEMIRFQKEHPSLRLLVVPDHATPLSLRTHHAMPIPFAVSGDGIRADDAECYSEKRAEGRTVVTGVTLFDRFITSDFR